MTPFEIAVPAIALGIAGVGILYVKWLERRLDRELAEERRDRLARRSRPAE